MRWKAYSDKDGLVIKRVLISDAGYKIARFSEDAVDRFRASVGGAFIGAPSNLKDAKQICENHHLLMGDRKSPENDDD